MSASIPVAVLREDLEEAIGAISTVHGEFCISWDRCGCYERIDRCRVGVAVLFSIAEAAHASTGPLSESLRAALDRVDFGDAQ